MSERSPTELFAAIRAEVRIGAAAYLRASDSENVEVSDAAWKEWSASNGVLRALMEEADKDGLLDDLQAFLVSVYGG